MREQNSHNEENRGDRLAVLGLGLFVGGIAVAGFGDAIQHIPIIPRLSGEIFERAGYVSIVAGSFASVVGLV